VTRENQARFSVNVNGLVTDSVTPPATLVYGKVFETGAYWKPSDALDGVGSKRFYNSAFVRANVGDVLTPSKVSMDVYRGGTSTTPAPAIGVELALVKMTWDAVAGTYGVGDVVATQTFQLAASTTAKTDRIDWTWSNPATAPVVALNTDNAANANLGGLWVAARFLGDSDALLGNNGPITGFSPAYGGSFNSFAMDNAGVLTTYTFTPAYTWTSVAGVTAFYNRPSRFMVEALGVVGPNTPPPPACPADLNHDNMVNGADLGLMLGAWGPCPSSPCAADLNNDGQVNGADLGLMLGAWGNCPV
ncbi:MAG: dockerin type I domain-containing protein, partial [Planctomycetota bacterium]